MFIFIYVLTVLLDFGLVWYTFRYDLNEEVTTVKELLLEVYSFQYLFFIVSLVLIPIINIGFVIVMSIYIIDTMKLLRFMDNPISEIIKSMKRDKKD